LNKPRISFRINHLIERKEKGSQLGAHFTGIMELLFVQFWHLWFWGRRFIKIKLFFEVFGLS
jgi:hypothetical protein